MHDMDDMKSAVLVSIFLKAFSAIVGLLVVPIYLRFMGVEAYGIIGVFTAFQALATLFDFGFGFTLTRELARFFGNSEKQAYSRDVARTFEITYFFISILIGLLIAAIAPLVAEHWVQLNKLTVSEVSRAILLGGIALSSQWPAALYSCGLSGVHKQVRLGIVTSAVVAARMMITIACLYLSPTLVSYFGAQIAASCLQTIGTRTLMWKSLVLPGHRPVFRFDVLKTNMRFARGMAGINITSILLMQVDKIILSHVLMLEDFGTYALCGTLAMGIYLIVSPVFSVIYPRFTTLLENKNAEKTVSLYHSVSQFLAFLVIPAAVVVAGFSREVLFLWTGNPDLGRRGAFILAFLIMGNACNGMMNIPYALQLASGWTTLAFWVNIGTIVISLPSVWWAAHHFGAVGGAGIWCLLNVGAFFLTPQIMHRRLLTGEMVRWYGKDVLPAFAVAGGVVVLLRVTHLISGGSRGMIIYLLGCFWVLASMATLLVLPHIRHRLHLLIRPIVPLV